MNDFWTEVSVSHHQFYVLDSNLMYLDTEWADYSNGLVVLMSHGAKIHTGIHTGNVRVRAHPLPSEPQSLDDGPWDDIVEASVYSATGQLAVEVPDPAASPDTYLALPELAHAGPGWYRLRAHARGRDTPHQAVQSDPVEDYLLQCWPAPRTPTHMIRTTDHCGQALRDSAAHHPTPPPSADSPATPPPDAQRRATEDNLRRQQRPPDSSGGSGQ
ncbi:hypothetical protein V1J52_24330 [Streptomyces sp. TRM 70351]|uniref:hypothetical protein n=1 Tax=Streptomyces sp. TRM 70351 TaxID=3116552 RepID=UPI002E7C2FFB|nr:hypothetical protein [Streptomyces sp. TRM 70351]MEE1931265.1 hypothetical protein [Streptomyces sp. TRM 70351]